MSKETAMTRANSNKQKLKDQKILLTGFLAEVTFFRRLQDERRLQECSSRTSLRATDY
jgi:hypothetical protein